MRLTLFLIAITSLFSTPTSHKIALKAIAFASPERSIPFTGFFRIKKQSAQFLKDLGAISIDEERFGFSGIFLSSSSVKKNSGKVFGKWREILKDPKNTKLLELFEANLASSSLPGLFSFPRDVHFLNETKNKTVILFVDYTLPLSMQIREILNFALRGYTILAVDFYPYSEGKNPISWDKCKKIAHRAYSYCSGNILLYGKSFGSAPASYLAKKHPSCPLILDRPFTSMNEVVNSIFLEGFIQSHYSYPTKKFIPSLQRDPLIIASTHNTPFKDHAERLLQLYITSQKNQDPDRIKSKCFISTQGGHYSSLMNKGVGSWFSYEQAQRKLNNYLLSLDNDSSFKASNF